MQDSLNSEKTTYSLHVSPVGRRVRGWITMEGSGGCSRWNEGIEHILCRSLLLLLLLPSSESLIHTRESISRSCSFTSTDRDRLSCSIGSSCGGQHTESIILALPPSSYDSLKIYPPLRSLSDYLPKCLHYHKCQSLTELYFNNQICNVDVLDYLASNLD